MWGDSAPGGVVAQAIADAGSDHLEVVGADRRWAARGGRL